MKIRPATAESIPADSHEANSRFPQLRERIYKSESQAYKTTSYKYSMIIPMEPIKGSRTITATTSNYYDRGRTHYFTCSNITKQNNNLPLYNKR